MAGLMGLNWHQQKEMLKLRGKLSVRQFMGEKAKILRAITTILVLTPVMLALAAATGAGYLLFPYQWPTQFLGLVLILSWLIWSIMPVISFNMNEGLDPTRLLIYPVARRDYLAHLLLGTLFDYPTYFFLPFILAIIIGFGLGFSLPFVLAAVFLVYLMMILTSQTIINVMGGILQSRRFRDISVIIGAFFGMSCWLISTTIQGGVTRFFDGGPELTVEILMNWHPLEIMKWLPPGAAAKSIEQATVGAWGGALLWLGYAAVWVLLLAWLWWRVTYRIITGQGFLLGRPPVEEKRKRAKSAGRRRIILWDSIPADIRAIALKDLKLKWRIPQSRIGLIYMYLMPVFAAVYPLFFGSSEEILSERISNTFIIGGTIFYTLLVYWANGQNMLGWETTGLASLLLAPIPRQRVFLGKALAQLIMNSVPIVALSLIAFLQQPSLIAIGLFPTSIGLGLACLAVVANFSALFPYPVNIEKKSGQNPFEGGGGCLTGLANGTLMPLMIAIFCFPAAAPLVAALWLDLDWLGLVGGGFALVYGVILYWFGSQLAANLLLQREPEILKATKPKESQK